MIPIQITELLCLPDGSQFSILLSQNPRHGFIPVIPSTSGTADQVSEWKDGDMAYKRIICSTSIIYRYDDELIAYRPVVLPKHFVDIYFLIYFKTDGCVEKTSDMLR